MLVRFQTIRVIVLGCCLGLGGSAFAQTIPTPTPTPTISPRVDTSQKVPSADLPNQTTPIAPNFQAPARPLPSSERVGVDLTNQMSLSLEEAVELALKNNNDIEASRTLVKIAEFSFKSSDAVYDPRFFSNSSYENLTNPVASIIGGAVGDSVTIQRLNNSAGLSGLTRKHGASYTASFNSIISTTTNTNVTLNPQYPLNFSLTYTQPLFRGRKFDLNRRNIEIARKNLGLTDSQFRQRAIDVISNVERAYWDLVFALRNLQVQIDAVKQAKTQLESNQRMVEKGVTAPIDIVAATAQITTFEQSVYSAQEDVTQAENTLKTLMLPDRTDATWSRPLTPVSQVTLDPPRIPLEFAITDALKNRPEMSQFAVNAEVNKIDEKFFRDQAKPQIDLVGTYTTQGLSGAPTDRPAPPSLQGSYFNSLAHLLKQDYPTYNVGVVISLPWKNKAAEANIGRVLAEGELIKNQKAQAEQIIEAQVRNTLQSLKSAEARLNAAIAARASAEQLYESEERLFRGGVTTFFLVQQRQTELLVARSRELQAQTDLNKAISAFQQATGNTLTVNNITVAEGGDLVQKKGRETTAFNSGKTQE